MLDKFTQQVLLSSEKFKKEKEYWLDKLSGDVELSRFPCDCLSLNSIQASKESYYCQFPSDIAKRAVAISNNSDMLLYTILLSGVKYLLSRYTDRDDVVIGMPVFKQGQEETVFQNNFLLLRTQINQEDNFKEIIYKIKETILESNEHCHFPFNKLTQLLSLGGESNNLPLLNTIVMLDGIHCYESTDKINSDMVIRFMKNEEQLKVQVDYNSTLYSEGLVSRIVNHLYNILDILMKDPNKSAIDLDVVSKTEKNQILYDFNHTTRVHKTLLCETVTAPQLFEEQVKQNPNQIAIVCNEKEITYKQLNIKANQLARRLLDQGVKRESIVGVMMERSIEMIVGILGILKAGGAYLPIDTDLPKQRVEYMLTDSECSHVLTYQNSIIKGVEFQGSVINLMDIPFEEEQVEDLQITMEPHNLAYVIYTSGSTGQPKGVMIEHRSLTNFLCAMYEDFSQDIGITDNVLFSSSISFDVTIFEIFVPLVYGARMTIYQGEKFDVPKLVQVILEEQVTLAYIPPTLLNEIYDYFVRDNQKIVLNKLLVGVEPIKTELLAKYDHLFRRNLQILNGYGPTEATVCCTTYRYESDKEITTQNVPIGSPLLNTKIYILDSFHRIQPIGVPGEICISGIGLARGYINRKELTADKFIDHPFEPGEKLYKTGDIARWLPDGNIEYLGRVDHQVKIRGYRIELGEIEASLLKYETIKTAVVIDQEDEDGEKYLCAYVVTEKDISIPEVRAYLATKLPHYMIPQQLIPIHNIPLTQNGKIDRSKLPKLNTMSNSNYVPPRNEIDSSLIDIWSSILGVNNIGINDNFFELGGHSLKGLKLFENIKRMFNVQLPLSLLFQKATIEQLSNVISRNKGIDSECLIPIQNGTNKDSQWFIVHGQGGGILNYYDLARELGEDKTVYGLQSIGYDDSRFPNLSVEEMAVRYIEEIKQVKKEGPYTLLGWSFGGIVAFEMARKLEELGDKVSFLGLLDVHPIEQGKEILSLNIRNAFEELEKFNDQLGIEKNSFEQMSEEQLIESLLKKFTLNENSCQQNFEDPMMNKLKVMIANRYAYLKYNCKQKIKADIFLFNASINDIHPLVDYNRWNEYTSGEVYALQVPGSHLSMLEKPHIHELVKSIKMNFKQMLLLAHVNK
ncbi:amino acid adenylation domain-containing protein [Bacillus cereus]|nr:non-ribosomal peptide synthetase [Bacillus cereus]TKH26522.1 amino acid adenylation domain-containing protein [Bacillus cereus]